MHKDIQSEEIESRGASVMCWGPEGGLVIAGKSDLTIYNAKALSINCPNNELIAFNEEVEDELSNDISMTMRDRVSRGYSMDCTKNLDIVGKDRKLKELWTWLARAEKMAKESISAGNGDHIFQGIYGIWMGLGSQRKSSPLTTLKNHTSTTQKPVTSQEKPASLALVSGDTHNGSGDSPAMVDTSKYAQRKLALATCGFGVSIEELEQKLLNLESLGEYDKASATALFSGLHDRAILALKNGSVSGQGGVDVEHNHKLIAAVLAGYRPSAEGANATLRNLCETLSNDMEERPYLHAILTFIASNDWYTVIDDQRLPLSERMAVALRVLDDEHMTAYLDKINKKFIEEADFEGIIVTGLTNRAIDLLEKVLDRSGDVQTVSLIMSFVVPRRFKDKRVEDWVENYRLLLDHWKQWHHRSKFDIERGKWMNSGEIAPPQVYVRCTYCAQSLGHSLLIQNVRNRDGKRVNVQTNVSPVSGGRLSGKQKPTVCPSCRKQLPRCALCLLYMGTPIDPLRQTIASNDSHLVDPAGFDMWFTWCQTCRHGGHAVHMLDWFQKHPTCPVSSCSCECQHNTY